MQFEKWFSVDLLNTIGHVQDIGTLMFTGDNNSHKIGVKLYKGTEPQTVTGTVVGYVIRGDGGTVAVSGSSSGNEAWIILPEAAFAYQGRISIAIQIVNGQEKTVVLSVSANVKIASTETAVDPGTIIPSVAELIDSIEAATASIPADYSSLLTTIAPEFSTTADYHAGNPVWHSGTLYRARENVSAGAWDNSKFEPVIISGGLPYTIGGNNTLELIATEQSASQFLYYDVGEALAGHVGETITVSFDLMGTIAREIRVYPYQSIGVSIADTVRVTPSVGAFSRVSFTTTVADYGGSGNHAGRIGLYDDAGAQTLTTRRFKIELGHVATPWAMSAQDALAQVSQYIDTATVAETKEFLGIT